MTESLGEALPREIERVQEIMPYYVEIGPPGLFALTMMRASVRRATEAMAAGDLPAMIAAYEDLKGYEA